MGIITKLIAEQIAMEAAGKTIKKTHITEAIDDAAEKTQVRQKQALEKEMEKAGGRYRNVLSAFVTEQRMSGLDCKWTRYNYVISDSTGNEQYDAVLERLSCTIKCRNDKNRKIKIGYKVKKLGREVLYSMFDGVNLGNVVRHDPRCGLYGKDVIKRLKKEAVNVYKYDYDGWALEESFVPHKVDVVDTFFLGKMASIHYVKGGFVVGFNNKELEIPFLMAAFVPLIERADIAYNDSGE